MPQKPGIRGAGVVSRALLHYKFSKDVLWFHRDKNVHQSHFELSAARTAPFSPFRATNGTLSKYHPTHFSHGMQEISETYFNSPPPPPPSVLRATLTSVCETRVEFFPMTGIRCIGGGAFPIECRRHRDETYLTFRAPCERKRFKRYCESELPLVSA